MFLVSPFQGEPYAVKGLAILMDGLLNTLRLLKLFVIRPACRLERKINTKGINVPIWESERNRQEPILYTGSPGGGAGLAR